MRQPTSPALALAIGYPRRGGRLRLGAYTLSRVIGRGGTGVVWQATHASSGADVAVKLFAATGRDPEGTKRKATFAREIGAIARLDHPNVLVLLDAGEVGPGDASPELPEGTPYVVTELAEADLARRRPGTWMQVREALLAILDGLAHAHARGVIHRDVKPENVFSVRGRWKLGDFGIAAVAGGDSGPARAGSPSYMAPEALRANEDAIGPPTDLYAVGCVAWELVSGEPPYGGPTVDDVIKGHLVGRLPTPGDWDVPDALHPWLVHLLAKDPARRPAFAADARAALLAVGIDGGRVTSGRRGPSTTWSTFDPLPEPDATDPPTDEVARGASTQDVPTDWRLGRYESPMPRHGAAVALVGLRMLPMFGREAERDVLWGALRAVGVDRKARWVRVTGASGIGRSRLAHWLGERAHEAGVARVVWRTRHRHDALPADPAAFVGDRPTVLVIDDVEREPEARALLEAALRARPVAHHPVLVVTTAANEALEADPDLAGWLDRLAGAAEVSHPLRLGPLPTAVMEAIVQQTLRVDPAVASELARRSAGHPAFVVDTVAEWVRRGDLVGEGRQYTIPEGRTPELPASVDRLGAARIARLEAAVPLARRALEVIAAHTAPVARSTATAVAAALGVDAPPWDAAIAQGLLVEDDGRLALTSPTLQANLVRVAGEAGRWTGLHAAIADRLDADAEPLERGWHRLEAGSPADALPDLDRAARSPVTGFLREDGRALTLQARALAEAGVPALDRRWADHHRLLALLRMSRGDLAGGRRAAGLALASSESLAYAHGVAEACRLLAQAERLEGRSGLPYLERALAEAAKADTPLPSATARNLRLNLVSDLFHADRFAEAQAIAAGWLGESPPEDVVQGMLRRALASMFLDMGRPDLAIARAQQALAIDTVHGRKNGVAFTHSILGEATFDTGDLDAAISEHERGLAMHHENGNLYGVRNELLSLARARSIREGVRTGFDEVTALTRTLGASHEEVVLYEVEAMARLGAADDVRDLLRATIDGLHPDTRGGLAASLDALAVEAEVDHPLRWRVVFDRFRSRTRGGYGAKPAQRALHRAAERFTAAGRPGDAAACAGLAAFLAARAAAVVDPEAAAPGR